MPITAQQKLEILREVGADPDKYWLDDEGNVIDLPKDSSAMAGAKTALLNLPRTAAGVGGAALGAAGAGALGLPTGPGAVAAGLAGGFGGAALGSTIGEKIQNALYPDAVLLAQQARSVRNPGAVQLGDLASQAVFMRPSISQLRDAGRGVRALATMPGFARLRPAQTGALTDVATGGLIEAGSTMAQGGDLSEILKNAAIGTLFSNPSGITKTMTRGVFKPHVADVGLRDAVNPADLLAKPTEPTVEKPREVNPELLKAYVKQQQADAKLAQQLAALKANQEAAAKKAQIDAEQGIGIEQPLPAQDYVLPPDPNSFEARFLRSQAVEPDVEITLDPQAPKPQPKPPVILEPGTPGALDQELGTRMTKPFFDWWANNAKENYRTRMTAGRPTGDQGQSVAGVTQGTRGPDGKRDITIDKNAYTDTAPHELTHGMILDVLQHGKKGEQAEMRRLLKAAGVEEEAFVQGVGEDVVRRFMDKTDDSWRSDFVSFMKYKFGKASPEDARRIMSNTMLRGGGPKGVSKIVAKPTQEVEEKPPVMPEPPKQEVNAEEMAKTYQPVEQEATPVNEEFNRSMQETRDRMRVDEMNRQNAQKVEGVRGEPVEVPVRRPVPVAEPAPVEPVMREEPPAMESPVQEAEQPIDLAQPRSAELVNQPQPNRPVGSARRGAERVAAKEFSKLKREVRNIDPAELTDVDRPVSRTYSGVSIPANVRRGRVVSENQRESAADLEARRIEAELAGEERPRYQEKSPEDKTFSTDFEKELSKDAPFKIQASKDGRLNRNDIKAAVSKLNPTEQEMLKEAGLEQYLTKVARPTKEELMAWAEENIPRVEVKELYATRDAQTNARQAKLEERMADIRHKLDTQYAIPLSTYNEARWEHSQFDALEIAKRGMSAQAASDFDLLINERADIEFELSGFEFDNRLRNNDSATRAYTQVNPRELKDMPGAVDLLVRMPTKYNERELERYEWSPTTKDVILDGKATGQKMEEAEFSKFLKDVHKGTIPKYPAKNTHYGQSGDNLLAHVRAYEHTMPDGERVLRVFEVQSDWAQARRRYEAEMPKIESLDKLPEGWRLKNYPYGSDTYVLVDQNDTGVTVPKIESEVLADYAERRATYLTQKPIHSGQTPGDPLLAQHQRLALKAAIEHARKRGIKRVVIDDAETAMLTEGHDRYSDSYLEPTKNNIDRMIASNESTRDIEKLKRGERIKLGQDNPTIRKWREEGFDITQTISQERGMRLAYDNVLQQQMRDLAGDGMKVELGEHKNAIDKGPRDIVERMPWVAESEVETRHFASEAEAREAARNLTARSTRGHVWEAKPNPELVNVGKPRQDLIFKNPDGTPKTTSTGYVYDVTAPQARREAGEPFSYAGRRYQQFGPNRPTSGLPDAEGRLSASPFESASQKAARSSNPVMRTVGRALTELFPAQRAMRGKYRALVESFQNLDTKDKDLLYKILIDEYRAGKTAPGTVPARLRKEYNDVRKTLRQMRDDQIAAGQRNADGAVPGIDDSYFPNVVDPSVRKTIVDEIDSPRFRQLKKEFVDFNQAHLVNNKGLSSAKAVEEANKFFNRFIGTLNKQPVEGAFDFGAVVLPEGSRLPDNWLHSDPAEAMSQYVRDWSRSRTFHDIVQTNEDVMAGLGQEEFFVNGKKTPVKNRVASPVVKDNNILHLLNEAVGIRRGSQDKITGAIGRAASAAWLANPITRSVDIATSLFKGLGMVTPTQIPGLISNMRNIGKSYERAHDTGWIREDGNTVIGEVLGAGEAFSNGVDKFSKGLSKYTGSEKLENFGRGLSQNIGEYIARTNKVLAQSGNKRSADFLDRVAPNWRTLSEAELGTRIGQLFQGRYDATNLPQWLSDSPAAPFFSLARWNIEQWNNFREFAIKPARNGDPVPLISMLVAGLAGGVGIKEIREALSGRKSKIATLKEIAEAPEGSAKYKEMVRYAGNLAQLSGTIGIVGELGVMALDAASKDRPAAPTMPALQITSDIIPRLIAAGNAMMDGQDPLTVMAQVSRDIGNEHVSAYRFLEGMAARTGVSDFAKAELDAANDRRDFRVGKRMRDEPIRAAVELPINYDNAEERWMEGERDPVKRLQLARELKAKIKQDPDKDSRERKMRAAAASRPSYLPSKDNDPKAFREQLDFVRRTQGPEKAEDLRLRYLRDKRNSDKQRQMFK